MAQQDFNVSLPNDGLGDALREAFVKQQEMNTELYENKVDKVEGLGLSQNSFTNDEKVKLAGIEAGAEVNVQSDWLQDDNTADDFIKNKPLIPFIPSFYQDRIISLGTTTVVDDSAIFSIGFVWDIANEVYQNGFEITRELPYATIGSYRTHVAYLTDDNDILIQVGDEDTVITPEPAIPVGTLRLQAFNVFGETITAGEPTIYTLGVNEFTNVTQINVTGATVTNPSLGVIEVDIEGGGVTEFLQLTDVDETTYTGQGGKVVAVKSDATGLEFIEAPGGGAQNLQEVRDIDPTVFVESLDPNESGYWRSLQYADDVSEILEEVGIERLVGDIQYAFTKQFTALNPNFLAGASNSITNTADVAKLSFNLGKIIFEQFKAVEVNNGFHRIELDAVETEEVTFKTPSDTPTGEYLIATREWVEDNAGGGASLIREEFTFGLSQTFTLANNYGQVYSVEVQGQGALSTSQYTLVSPNQITINDTLNSGDYVVIIYSNAITGVQPYYSQAETEALVNSVALLKSVGPTYTTNAILSVTQAEYDALTPDPTTLYVIL